MFLSYYKFIKLGKWKIITLVRGFYIGAFKKQVYILLSVGKSESQLAA
jgi:hypothetical protein